MLKWRAETREWAFCEPSLQDASMERRDEVRRLGRERDRHEHAIECWLAARG